MHDRRELAGCSYSSAPGSTSANKRHTQAWSDG
jgi:hypothetical protein